MKIPLVLSFIISLWASGGSQVGWAAELEESDFPIIVRFKNTRDYSIYLENEAKEQGIEIMGKEFHPEMKDRKYSEVAEILVNYDDLWKVYYTSGHSRSRYWNFDQPLIEALKLCKDKIEDYKSELHICDVELIEELQARLSKAEEEIEEKEVSEDSGFFAWVWQKANESANYVSDMTYSLKTLSGRRYFFDIKRAEATSIDRSDFKNLDISSVYDGSLLLENFETVRGSIRNLLRRSKSASSLFDRIKRDLEAYKTLKLKKHFFDSKQNIIVFGDQGTGAEKSQVVSQTVKNMSIVCQWFGCDFGISAGDNIYNEGPLYDEDGNWVQEFVAKFVSVFYPLRLPIYLAIGNHDLGLLKYKRSPSQEDMKARLKAQVEFSKRNENPGIEDSDKRMWNLEGPYYSRLIEENGIRTYLIFLETNHYPSDFTQESIDNDEQKRWLESQLSTEDARNADWRIVVGHHPLYSVGRHGVNHGDTDRMSKLKEELRSLFCQGNVNFYLAGHDHHLELDAIPCEEGKPVMQILSGAAAKGELRKVHEKDFSFPFIFGAESFSPKLVANIEPFIWGNGFTRDQILRYAPVKPIHGFAFLQFSKIASHSSHAEPSTSGVSYENRVEINMYKTAQLGPQRIGCWAIDGSIHSETEYDSDGFLKNCDENEGHLFQPTVTLIKKLNGRR
jgi:tartrate-resistant acid phosphatase type 5